MRLGSVILKVLPRQVADTMWYFPLLKPYVDHVPVKADLSDLEVSNVFSFPHCEALLWIQSNWFIRRKFDGVVKTMKNAEKLERMRRYFMKNMLHEMHCLIMFKLCAIRFLSVISNRHLGGLCHHTRKIHPSFENQMWSVMKIKRLTKVDIVLGVNNLKRMIESECWNKKKRKKKSKRLKQWRGGGIKKGWRKERKGIRIRKNSKSTIRTLKQCLMFYNNRLFEWLSLWKIDGLYLIFHQRLSPKSDYSK